MLAVKNQWWNATLEWNTDLILKSLLSHYCTTVHERYTLTLVGNAMGT